MKRLMSWLIISFMLSLQGIVFAEPVNAPTDSPVGFWKTVDDVTGQTKSIVQITPNSANVLSGKVVKLFDTAIHFCTECTGEKHNQPILGMVVMTDLKKSEENAGEWVNGSVIDPKNGKVYHCKLQLSKDGEHLTVRGYIGFPLFGRSQTWERVEGV